MSVSLQPVDEHSISLLPHHDQRDAPTHSPALSSSPIPPSPSSAISASSGPSTATDAYSPFSLPAIAPIASPSTSDAEDSSSSSSASARIRSLITGVSTSLIASAVREKAYSDLQRLEEIFASPAEQAHLTKQQKWKLALRQQRLKLYLQQNQLEQQAEHDETQHDADAAEGTAASEATDAADGQQSAHSAGTYNLTIFTTPPLPPNAAPSLAAELSSFSLYTPDSLNAATFTFVTAPPLGLRTPSAPAEAQYTIAADDERLQTESDDSSVLDEQHATLQGIVSPSQPSTPTSASSATLPQRRLPPHQRRATSRQRAPSPLVPSIPTQVSRSGRTIKRRFDVSSIGGRKSRRVVTDGSHPAEDAESRQEEPKMRAWERSYNDEDSEEEEGSEEDEAHAGAQHTDYGVAYRQH